MVGTEHYTDLSRVSPGPVGSVTVEAEPGNRSDKNAVLVRWNGKPVGYLSRARAQTYRPMLSGVHPVDAYVKRAAVNTNELALFVMLPKVHRAGSA